MPDPRNRLKWNATCKVYPAVADLQAIKAQFINKHYLGTQDCRDMFGWTVDAADAGELCIITGITMKNDISICDLHARVTTTEGVMYIKSWYDAPADQWVKWDGWMLLKAGQGVGGYWDKGGATDKPQICIFGYKTDLY